jgi:hypothetical protein
MKVRPAATSLCKSTIFNSTKEHSTAFFSFPTDEYDSDSTMASSSKDPGCRRECDSNTGRPQSNQKDSWLRAGGLILKLANGIISFSGSDGSREFKRWNIFFSWNGLQTKLLHRNILLSKYYHWKGQLDTTQFFRMGSKSAETLVGGALGGTFFLRSKMACSGSEHFLPP